jgi:hypothetical protein
MLAKEEFGLRAAEALVASPDELKKDHAGGIGATLNGAPVVSTAHAGRRSKVASP